MKKPILNFLMCLIMLGACNSSPNRDQIIQPGNVSEVSANDSLAMIKDHDTLGRELATHRLHELLYGKGQLFTWDTLIKNSSTAIALAEPIMFDIYGKDQIVSQRPYEVYLVDGYWYLSGTIPKGWKGGGFEIIISARDAKVIRLTHYK